MYKLEKRIESKGHVKSYVVKDLATGAMHQLIPKQFRDLVLQQAVVAVRIQDNRLVGAGLRCIVEEQTVVEDRNISMYADTQLDKYIRAKLHNITKRRSEYATVMYGIQNAPHNVTVISGTRRTGKTVLMLQAIQALRQTTESICYLNINSVIDFDTLYTYLQTNCKQYKYIFIDEITRCTHLVDSAAVLSDVYCYSDTGHKLVLTGTESYAFCMARSTTLYERMTLVNTSLLLYKDYYNLFAKPFADYYKRANMYENYNLALDASLIDMLSITYINNVCNTLQRNLVHNLVEFKDLRTLSTDELKYCLFTIFVKGYANSMAVGKINGNTVLNVDNKAKQQIKKILTRQIVSSLLRETLDAPQIEPAKMRTVYNVLYDLGALYSIRNVYIADEEQYNTEPTLSNLYIVAVPSVCYALSMRYNRLLDVYCAQHDLRVQENDNQGHLVESAVMSNLCKFGYSVQYYRDTEQREVDCVVYNETAQKVYLVEIKSSTSPDSHHAKHLNDDVVLRICTAGGKYQATKYVVYGGKTVAYGDVTYVNVEDFLCNLDAYLA